MNTRPSHPFFLPTLIAGLGLMLAGRVTAQTFTTLHSFNEASDGASPQAGLIISGNTLYGATDWGSTYRDGSVFKVNMNGTGFTTLHDFTGTFANGNSDGANPDGTLTLSGNTLYGTTYYGGSYGNGTVFEVNTYGTCATLYSFTGGSDGACPEVGLVLSGNTLYGTTERGGSSGYGTVFRINIDGTGFVNLHSFTNGSDGSVPHSLVLSGNALYGTTLGLSGNGTVFAVNTSGTGFRTLHSFTATNFTFQANDPAPGYSNTDGVGPTGLILSGNTLYGTTYWGGANGNGTVFKVSTDGTGFTTLHSLAATSGSNFTNSEGTHPIAFTGLILSGNTLYGTAKYGGNSGNGTVFALNINGTGFVNLYNFTGTDINGNNSDGANPYAGLVLLGNTLYGTAVSGGSSGNGTLFSLTLPTVQFSVDQIDGVAPLSVQFTCPSVDSGGAIITAWNWSFGDGSTSAAQNPSHTYTTAGTFSPALIATNNLGITVSGSGPAIIVSLPTVQYAANPTNRARPGRSVSS